MPFTLQDYYTSIGKRLVDESNGTVTLAAQLEFLNSSIRRALRKFDIPQSERIQQMALYFGVEQYAAPSDYKQAVGFYDQYRIEDNLNFKRVDEFDFWRTYPGSGNIFSESRDTTSRYILARLADQNLTNQTLHNCDTFDGNGTWIANTSTSDAANVTSDTLYVREGSGSIKFDIDVSQSVNNFAEISVTGMTSVDLSDAPLFGNGVLFIWVYLPSATNYTSFTMRWGSDASNYYENTVTTQFHGGAFVVGWNLLGFEWTTATTIGSPTSSAIDYLLFRATYPASFSDQTGLRIDFIVMREKRFVNLHYLSDAIVVDGSTGALKDSFSSTTDTSSYLNCDREFVDWITYMTLEDVYTYYAQNPQKAAYNRYLREELEKDLYMDYPSRREIPTKSYIETDSLADNQN